MHKFILIPLLLIQLICKAQFAPQAGLPGSTAIHKDSAIIVEWATECSVQRGWMDIADTTLGKTITGDSSKAFGMADADVVSLGDGGQAILYFSNPLINGPGADFAVFENGFRNPSDSAEAFLELATIEVSNNGLSYFAFAAQCENDSVTQIPGAGVYMNATKINNLAGKYISYYGTPFDLDELSGTPTLDVNDIHFIRIRDVVGSMAGPYGSSDIHNHKINDPYPTPFPTGGFDLDAVAVIHHKFPTELPVTTAPQTLCFYPNPGSDYIRFQNDADIRKYRLLSAEGRTIMQGKIQESIYIGDLHPGLYFIETENKKEIRQVHSLIKL